MRNPSGAEAPEVAWAAQLMHASLARTESSKWSWKAPLAVKAKTTLAMASNKATLRGAIQQAG
jgi:hypothetical protein